MRSPDGSGRVPAVWLTENAHMSRAQIILAGATILAYAIGYPLALIGNNSFGWVLVTLGGVLLLALGVVTIRRIHRSSDNSADQPSE